MRTKTVFFLMTTCLTLSATQLTGCDALEGVLGDGDEKEDGDDGEDGEKEEADGGESDEANPKDQVSVAGICEKFNAKAEGDEEWTAYVAEQEEGRGDCEEYLTTRSTSWDASNPTLEGQLLGIHDRCLDESTTSSEFDECYQDSKGKLMKASKRHKEREAGE